MKLIRTHKVITAVTLILLIAVMGAAASPTKPSKKVAPPTPTRTTAVAATPTTYLAVATDTGTHVTSAKVKISGEIAPGANLIVDGDAVSNRAGKWSTTVILNRGDNVVNFAATEPNHTDSLQAISITRDLSAAERAAQRRAAAVKREADRQRRAAEAAARQAKREEQKQAYLNSAVTIAYNQINKDADAEAGKVVHYSGQIFQIQESPSGGGIMLVSVTDEGYGLWDNNIWVDYDGHVSGAEGDMVSFTGDVVGSKSYDTQAGGTTYVPEVRAKYITEG